MKSSPNFLHCELGAQMWMKAGGAKVRPRRAELAERGGIPAATGPAATYVRIHFKPAIEV
jgi:hypothetical protein